jgi:hypothetical protein
MAGYWISRLALSLILTAGSVVALSVPAEANLLPYRWSTGLVCVEDHVSSHWPIGSATSRVSGVPDITLVLRGDCSAYKQRIKVYEYSAADDLWAKVTWWYYAGTNRLALVKVYVNNRYRGELNWADRRSVLMHEELHGLGLAHTSYCCSLMNVYRWRRYDYPTSYDKREVERRYPW